VRLVATPDAHKDANDWLRVGATGTDFAAAVEAAVIVPPPPPLANKRQRATCPDWAELGLVTINEEKRKQFPTDALPPPFSEMVRQVATINQVPESLPAIITLGIMASGIGRGIAGRLFRDKVTRANLYLIAAVASGEGKTTTCDPLRKPLEDLASERQEAWTRNVLPQAMAKKAVLGKQNDALQKQVGGDTLPAEANNLVAQIADKTRELGVVELELVEPALIVEDITSEKLAVVLKQSGETLSLISSDGGDVVANIAGRYRNKATVDDSIYVKAYSGDPVRVSRVNRPSLKLESPCLTMLLLLQHDKLDILLSTSRLIEGGLMPRFLMARISCAPSHVGTEVVQIPPETVKAYDIAIRALVENFRDRTEAIVVVGTPSARKAIADYYNEIADRRANTLKDIGGFAARWHEQACRIAVVLHAVKPGSNAHQQEIQEDTVVAAIEIAKWFEGEQLAILEHARVGGLEQRLTAVWRYAHTMPQGFTRRDLMRKHKLWDTETAEAMLVQLEEKGVITSERKDTGGRPTLTYCLADLT